MPNLTDDKHAIGKVVLSCRVLVIGKLRSGEGRLTSSYARVYACLGKANTLCQESPIFQYSVLYTYRVKNFEAFSE